MHFKKILIMFTALTLLGSMSIAMAQDEQKTEGIARVALITAKDGHAKELEEAIVKYHHYMGTKPGSLRWQWFSIETGEDTGKYIARTGNHNWADFDVEHDWDEESGAKFRSLVQPHIANTVITMTRRNDELGIWPESMEGYQYFSVSNWHIKPGQGSAFKEGLKKVDGILKANGWPDYYRFFNYVSGGPGNTTMVVSPRKNFADMAPKVPDFWTVINKAMSEEEAKAFMAEWGSTYKWGSNKLVRYMAEQSDYGDSK